MITTWSQGPQWYQAEGGPVSLPQYFSDELSLFQPKKVDSAHPLQPAPPKCFRHHWSLSEWKIIHTAQGHTHLEACSKTPLKLYSFIGFWSNMLLPPDLPLHTEPAHSGRHTHRSTGHVWNAWCKQTANDQRSHGQSYRSGFWSRRQNPGHF